jgi:hypothetical protein
MPQYTRIWWACGNFIIIIYKLGASVKDDTIYSKRKEKQTTKMPTLRKIKRAASRPTSQRFCSTFNFTQPHPKPTHHPTSGQLTN